MQGRSTARDAHRLCTSVALWWAQHQPHASCRSTPRAPEGQAEGLSLLGVLDAHLVHLQAGPRAQAR